MPRIHTGSPAGFTFSVRLSRKERTRLLALAEAEGVQPSALVRSWIAQGRPSVLEGEGEALRARRTVPRWALLPSEERSIAQAIHDATERSEFGIVLLEDVLDAVERDGMPRLDAMRWLTEMISSRLVEQTPAEVAFTERLEGKSSYLFTYGRLTAHARERLPLGGG